MIAVLSCPRSGSTYVQQLLAKTGLHLGHERPLEDGVVGFPFDLAARHGLRAAVCQVALTTEKHDGEIWPYIPAMVWRPPADTIASMLSYFQGPGYDYFARTFPAATPLETMSVAWVTINRLLRRATDTHINLYDLEDPETGAYERLCGACGVEPNPGLLPFRHPDHAMRLRPVVPVEVDEAKLLDEAGLR